MNNFPVRLRILSLLVLTTLFSCSDHQFPGLSPARLRVKTLTGQNGSYQLVSAFQYDQQGQLSGIKTIKSDSTRRESSTYTYDSQHQLSQIQRVIQLNVPQITTATKTDSYTFSYTGAGQISKIRYVNNAVDSLIFISKPQYDATNRIVGNQVDSYNGYQAVQFTTQYAYTNTNLTSVRITFSPGGQTSDRTFTYDSKPNPFYGIIMPIATPNMDPVTIDPVSVFAYPPKYDGIANLLSLSRNNVTSDGYNDYIYTYNSAGLPISRTAIRAGFPERFLTGVLYLEYESY